MKAWALFVPLLVATFANAQGTPPTETDCKDSPLRTYLNQPSGRALLKAYGYELDSRFKCRELHSPHTTATILRFRMSELDNVVSFTILQIPGFDQPSVIPISSGMLAKSNRMGDDHNIAAFNLLLAALPRNPSSAKDRFDLGRLYMAIVGMPELVPSATPAVLADLNDCDRCEVPFTDRPDGKIQDRWWTLNFVLRSNDKRPHLEGVSSFIADRASLRNQADRIPTKA